LLSYKWRFHMADIFISFKTDDTPRVQAIYDGFRARGLTVFWSNDIPAGALNYQAIIKDELLKAPVVVVVWTRNSVQSHPVAQEGAQAERANKLFQVLLDDIEPIDFPMEVRFKAQKTMLLGWTGTPNNSEWIKLNNAIDARLRRKSGAVPAPAVQTGSQGGGWLEKAKAYFGGHAPVTPGTGETRAVARPAWASDAGQDKFGRWAEFALGDARQRMRWIEPGTFMMGSPEGEAGRRDDEEPHKVRLSGFWLGDTPVTQALWTVAMGSNPSTFRDPNRPVECVSWNDAQQFLNKMNALIPGLGLSLPREAQWEYACRAGTDGPNYANDAGKLADIAWFWENSGRQTRPVATKRCNHWGLYDMLGNVWEWCADAPRHYYNPFLARRGGSWQCSADRVRAAGRSEKDPGSRSNDVGFRCCA
jgi:formylglycine-generating enzyme required for sulfatase activity